MINYKVKMIRYTKVFKTLGILMVQIQSKPLLLYQLWMKKLERSLFPKNNNLKEP